MTQTQILQELEALAERLSVPLSYEKGDIRGGLCWVEGKPRIIIRKGLPLAQRVNILLLALCQLPLENVFIPPKIRKFLDKATPDSPE